MKNPRRLNKSWYWLGNNVRPLQALAAIVLILGGIFTVYNFLSGEPPTRSAPSPCDAKIKLQREIAFRLEQVDMAMKGNFLIEDRNLSESCKRARTIFVAAKLGGIFRRPPPKENETIWIGGSGYGYRHTPFKTGARSDEFASFSLPELVSDYITCSSNGQSRPKGGLESEVARFETTAASKVEQVLECNSQWIDGAITSWSVLRETANRLIEDAK